MDEKLVYTSMIVPWIYPFSSVGLEMWFRSSVGWLNIFCLVSTSQGQWAQPMGTHNQWGSGSQNQVVNKPTDGLRPLHISVSRILLECIFRASVGSVGASRIHYQLHMCRDVQVSRFYDLHNRDT